MNKKLGASLKACCTGSVRHEESVNGSETHSITRLKTMGGSFVACIVAVSIAGNLYAEPPDLKGDKGLPRYLESEFAVINEKLDRNAELMGDLSEQLIEVEKNLKLEIGSARQEILAHVAALASDVAAVEDLLLEPEKTSS